MTTLRRIIASAQEELELIREMKDETTRYRQNSIKNGSHEVSRLTLNAHLTKHREIEEVIREASETVQRILADIRITRIGIQEKLAVQDESGEADKLNTVFTSIKESFQKPAEKPTGNKLETMKY
jgi:phosphomevalonate kinase